MQPRSASRMEASCAGQSATEPMIRARSRYRERVEGRTVVCPAVASAVHTSNPLADAKNTALARERQRSAWRRRSGGSGSMASSMGSAARTSDAPETEENRILSSALSDMGE